jgi:hypothetical protein
MRPGGGRLPEARGACAARGGAPRRAAPRAPLTPAAPAHRAGRRLKQALDALDAGGAAGAEDDVDGGCHRVERVWEAGARRGRRRGAWRRGARLCWRGAGGGAAIAEGRARAIERPGAPARRFYGAAAAGDRCPGRCLRCRRARGRPEASRRFEGPHATRAAPAHPRLETRRGTARRPAPPLCSTQSMRRACAAPAPPRALPSRPPAALMGPHPRSGPIGRGLQQAAPATPRRAPGRGRA